MAFFRLALAAVAIAAAAPAFPQQGYPTSRSA
jgi:hypothetical protein